MRISDWSSDVCSSDLARMLEFVEHRFEHAGVLLQRILVDLLARAVRRRRLQERQFRQLEIAAVAEPKRGLPLAGGAAAGLRLFDAARHAAFVGADRGRQARPPRSEERTCRTGCVTTCNSRWWPLH